MKCGLFMLMVLSMLGNDAFACSFPLPRAAVMHEGKLVPEFSDDDFAFKGEIVGNVNNSDRNGYVLRVTQSWTGKLRDGDIFEVDFFDYDLARCSVVKPSVMVKSDALAIGTSVRVVSSSREMSSGSFGWEFYAY